MQVLALTLWLASVAPVDEWVLHSDGRVGGCYRTESGQLYSCTPQPDAVVAPADPSGAASIPEADTREELRVVRRELEQLKLRQAEDDARRLREQTELDRAEREEQSAEQRDLDAAMEAYNAIEAAKDSLRLRELDAKTEACRKKLEARGYRIVGPGACKAPDGVFMNCPEC